MTDNVTLLPVRSLVTAWVTLVQELNQPAGHAGPGDVKVFLECDREFEDYFRSAVDLVTYVHDRRDADVCVLAEPVPAEGVTCHYRVSFIGVGRFELIEASALMRLPHVNAPGSSPHGPRDAARESREKTDRDARRPASAVTP